MSDASELAPIHSLGEAYLYTRVTPCPLCGGPLDSNEAWFHHDPVRRVLALEIACRLCEAPFDKSFDASGVPEEEFAMLTSGPLAPPWNLPAQVLNHTPDPSHVLDVADWLTLFTVACEEARIAGDQGLDLCPPDRVAIRRMRLVAGACLDEALKFFDEDNDLPPDSAFFSDANRNRFWERPQLFTRQYITDLRFSLMKQG
ncbi:MAG TPA: hypothetical protein PKG54_04810 [Phycisphaerae bacterium]|nr:hypothetical protein [Phycisphaerae bacterium]HOB73827.1 hypothetical protein [Phycisphaerae bacterium]HOJ53958.1 hypothetical protein [Phycisphaerae bacterium]HOL27537.1 hypothetical protein [Phycisphaerae bacterium]HPP22580.1 hypothetical protein [Phycisphaerae bacterium]